MTTAPARPAGGDAPRSVRFGPLTVRFGPEVIEPRPWTLLQSRWASAVSSSLPAGPILELCCGAGHIGLVTAAATGRRLVQVDANAQACAWAVENATAAGLAGAVDVRHARLSEAVRSDERFPLVLADPPYLPTADTGRYADDPVLAIDGGLDGLELIAACAEVAGDHLVGDGLLSVQVRGRAQAREVSELLCGQWVAQGIRSAGHDRAVMHLRRSPR